MRPVLISLFATLACAADPPSVRELVDRLKGLEAQVALIERESAVPVDRAALWAGATRGLVEAADPRGSYLTASELAIHGLGSEAQRVALGFDWRREGAEVLVTRVVPGSPAAQAGIHPGCLVLSADGVAAGGDRRAFADALARGQDRKRLRVRPAEGDELDLEVTRSELHDDGVARSGMIAPGILHLRIGRFLPASAPEQPRTATAEAVRAAIAGAPALRAVVLDLRGCPGGSLQAAVEIASCWLAPDSAVVEQSGRDPSRSRTYSSAEGPRLTDAPVVVLVDASTASSAEVLAQALRRTRRAPLLGVPTHGKWSVQQLFLLPGGDAMTLTVAHLRVPGGERLDGPLTPDVTLEQAAAVTWRRWRAELAGNQALPPDPQLERAVEQAATLALAAGR